MLWVAGVPTSLANLPATGTATYTGHAIANIAAGGSGHSYLAAGTFSAAVNFGARNGAITIGGLDGTNYTGTAVWVPSTVTFNGTLTGNVGSRTAALAGSFFQGGATNTTPLYGEMGGSLILNGAGGYLGSGIFAAQAIGRGGGDRSIPEVVGEGPRGHRIGCCWDGPAGSSPLT